MTMTSAPADWSFSEVCREAKRIGACLQTLGLAKGDRLALVLNAPEDFVLSFLGAVSAGVMPVPMYPPLALGRLDNYIDRAVGILRVSGAKALLTTKELIPVLQPVLSRVPTLKSILDIETLQQMRGPAAERAWRRSRTNPAFSNSRQDPPRRREGSSSHTEISLPMQRQPSRVSKFTRIPIAP